MSTRSDRTPRRLLAIGALERDNFGDLLYAHLLESHAGDSLEIAWGAPILPATSADIGREVIRWPDALANERLQGVWILGGEIGGTPPEYAYMTRFGRPAHGELIRADAATRTSMLQAAMGGRVLDPPYIGRPSAYAANHTTPLVLNSVGISGIARETGARRHALTAALREAAFVGVRDRASGRLLDELGIAHRIAPDLAHTVARVRQRPQSSHGAILVHLSEHALTQHQLSDWADALSKAVTDSHAEIRLFLAGLAPGHDSLDSAAGLRRLLLDRFPRRNVTISGARGVWERTDEIAGARLWIGSSLHGRIVASAYGVPRVSFAKPKVDGYAQDWDADFPFGIGPAGLAAAVSTALSMDASPDDSLADAAAENIYVGLASLKEFSSRSENVVLAQRLRIRVRESDSLIAQGRSAEDRLADSEANANRQRIELERRVRRLERDLENLGHELGEIRSSRRWRLFARLDQARDRLCLRR